MHEKLLVNDIKPGTWPSRFERKRKRLAEGEATA
jgi:hypothetical protein